MRKRNIFVVFLALIIIFVISVLAFIFWQKTQTPPVEVISQTQSFDNTNNTGSRDASPNKSPAPTTPSISNAELIDIITEQTPSLVDSNQQPIFGIVNSIRTPSSYYVVTIIDKSDPTVGQAKIILKDSGSAGLVLVAGPGTSFSRDNFTFPDDVWKLL